MTDEKLLSDLDFIALNSDGLVAKTAARSARRLRAMGEVVEAATVASRTWARNRDELDTLSAMEALDAALARLESESK